MVKSTRFATLITRLLDVPTKPPDGPRFRRYNPETSPSNTRETAVKD